MFRKVVLPILLGVGIVVIFYPGDTTQRLADIGGAVLAIIAVAALFLLFIALVFNPPRR